MNKILTSKQFTAVLVAVTVFLSLLSLINSQFKSKIVVEQNSQSLNISLANGQYIVLRPEADYIIDGADQKLFKPFGGLNQKEYKENGFDFLFIRRSFIQKITSNDNSREVLINPINQNSISIKYIINTNLYYGDTSTYTVQLDYSRNSEFKFDGNKIIIEDNDCQIIIENTNEVKAEKLNDYASLIFTQSYSDVLNLDLKISQSCK